MKNNQINCPHCKSNNTNKRGYFHSKAHGKQQRYYCKSCNHKFIQRNAFYRMRNSPQKITLCLDLFFKGISTRQVQSHLQAFYPHNSSHKTIYLWIVKYSNLISNYTDNLKLKVGTELQVDEMEIGKKTSKSRGWFIDSIDCDTRFMVASEFTKQRTIKEIKSVLKLAKRKTDNQIKICTTDGFNAYIKSVKVLGVDKRKTKNPPIIHKVVTQLKNEGCDILCRLKATASH